MTSGWHRKHVFRRLRYVPRLLRLRGGSRLSLSVGRSCAKCGAACLLSGLTRLSSS